MVLFFAELSLDNFILLFYDFTMIKLYQFPPMWKLPNASTFCLKLEAYLRLANIPYQSVYIANPGKGPKGKCPYIEDNGLILGDSHLIIQYLTQAYPHSLDDHLSSAEQALGYALARMVEEHLYWVIVYSRWVKHWDMIKRDFFASLPAPLQWIVPPLVRKTMLKQLHMQGMGRHSEQEVYAMGQADIACIAQLFKGPFLFGDKPSSYDAALFAILANISHAPIDDLLSDELHKHPQLVQYANRILQTYFSS